MVRWNWNAKFGEMVNVWKSRDGKKYRQTIGIYKGNCFGVLIQTFYKKDEATNKRSIFYNFNGYWNNELHLRQCLGLVKNKSNIYEETTLVRLNTFYTRTAFERKELMQIAKDFTKAGIKVSLYYKEPKPEKKKKEEE